MQGIESQPTPDIDARWGLAGLSKSRALFSFQRARVVRAFSRGGKRRTGNLASNVKEVKRHLLAGLFPAATAIYARSTATCQPRALRSFHRLQEVRFRRPGLSSLDRNLSFDASISARFSASAARRRVQRRRITDGSNRFIFRPPEARARGRGPAAGPASATLLPVHAHRALCPPAAGAALLRRRPARSPPGQVRRFRRPVACAERRAHVAARSNSSRSLRDLASAELLLEVLLGPTSAASAPWYMRTIRCASAS